MGLYLAVVKLTGIRKHPYHASGADLATQTNGQMGIVLQAATFMFDMAQLKADITADINLQVTSLFLCAPQCAAMLLYTMRTQMLTLEMHGPRDMTYIYLCGVQQLQCATSELWSPSRSYLLLVVRNINCILTALSGCRTIHIPVLLQ